MKIVVCVKQVPDTNEVKIDPVKGTLIREGVPAILNPDDANALEEALKLKDKYEDVKVTVITMGIPSSSYMLRECLAMGADEAILVTDRAFAGADTWATSNALASALRKVGDYDLIFAGRQAIDGDTAQVGPEMAEHLNIPQVTYVEEVKLQDEELEIKKALEDGYEVVSVKMPVLLTAIKDLNTPRYMHMAKIVECCNKEIKVWNADDIGADKSLLGLSGSPTKVKKSVTKETKRDGILVNKPFKEAAQYAISKLKEKHYI